MCYTRKEFKIGDSDVFLGAIEGQPFYISGPQFAYWRHTGVLIDVVQGRGSGFSLEAPEGIRFLIRSVVFTEDQMKELEALGEPRRGLQELI
jgi:hypothetical protein